MPRARRLPAKDRKSQIIETARGVFASQSYAKVGTATRCKVCGLSIRGPLGFVNRAVWGITPLAKHPDLCNV